MKIYLASDHAGFSLKEALAQTLIEAGHEVVDKRAYQEDAADDYPDLVRAAVEPLSKEKTACAIILGGSGQGEAIAANRIVGVRAAVYYGGPLDIVKLSREHNDANVLSLGARFLSVDEAKSAVVLWLDTAFSGDERHKRRIAQIDAPEV
ncbi:MAG: RpiB/LacA/LacB family sugar-phosphate isomerase [Patescibacteria group bacterium]